MLGLRPAGEGERKPKRAEGGKCFGVFLFIYFVCSADEVYFCICICIWICIYLHLDLDLDLD